ncbi:ABC transporter ATP-binding protein [Agromyces atrinae]|uniref:ABC transporter ATP-binding protein n=1 Tax=Agromyces atrinae TaxID=592376 RepID=A0A4Q2M466_9MICO|nr:ABC transporter ATP-binding protein [Agromyces atrinae]NYD67327.1 putative ABC transport system ATP-binding protein [Agromyces atrinae]RXZ86844.1 ABC transporter ATP-binding protein [Agromyces atrinae]
MIPPVDATRPAPTDSSARPAARAIDVVRDYGSGTSRVRALDGLSIELRPRRFTAIMGASGSGKSTLLHCLAGLDQPTSGRIMLGATELGRLDDAALTRVRRDRIGFVFQDGNLLPHLSAGENIDLGASLAGRRPDRGWRSELVDRLGISDRLRHLPAELSGGQRQRVAVARALLGRPDLIVADEPTGALDSTSGRALLELLRSCVDEFGQTVVMVTHDAAAAAITDEVILLTDGRVAGILTDPTHDSVLERVGALSAATA